MYEKEVRAGIGLLDRIFNGEDWRSYIDRKTLRMQSYTDCILGQLGIMMDPLKDNEYFRNNRWAIYNRATAYIERTEHPYYNSGEYSSWVDAYGFDTPDSLHTQDYVELRDTWVRLMDGTAPNKEGADQ